MKDENGHIIEVENLVKKFGDFPAVNDISFFVEEGEIFGFLGPNGAGKTTTINILCTLMKPTSGRAILNDFDVVRQQNQVRQSIGLVFQDPSLDDRLTAMENLRFHTFVYNVPAQARQKRIEEVLNMVELWERRKGPVRTFSGGMRRRLEIARGLLHYPKVLFLDEPTLGLDPQTRNRIWEYILELRDRERITIFLTTHYMDEAAIADRIAVIDYGKIVALDTPDNLRDMVGGDIISLRTGNNKEAAEQIRQLYQVEVRDDGEELSFEIPNGEKFIPGFISSFKTEIYSINLRRPTLDDVFLKLTGREIRDESWGSMESMRDMVRRSSGPGMRH